MSYAIAAETQVVLEGVPLPAEQPARTGSQPHEPGEESGKPPGGEDYTRVSTGAGDVSTASDL